MIWKERDPLFSERAWWPSCVSMGPNAGPAGAGTFLIQGVPERPSQGRALTDVESPAWPSCVSHHLFPRRPPDVQRPAPASSQQGNQSTHFRSFACSPLPETPLLKKTIHWALTTHRTVCALRGPWFDGRHGLRTEVHRESVLKNLHPKK